VRALLHGREGKSKSSIAISIAVHAVMLAGLAAITFHYPIDQLFRRPDPVPLQTIRYVRIAPEPVKVVGRPNRRPPSRGAGRPVELPVPTSIPVGIPAPVTGPVIPSVAAGGGSGDPGRVVGIAPGLRPGIPDPRLATNPMIVGRVPETEAQKAERALSAIYSEYVDSVRAQQSRAGRAPGDWSWGGKDGEKWGWDEKGIRIAGVTIPNMVLAALPLNLSPQGRNMNALIDGRNDACMRADIKSHANLMTEVEFKTAIRKIRERIDRERQEKMAKARPKTPPCCN
jgi:hypothetical protein